MHDEVFLLTGYPGRAAQLLLDRALRENPEAHATLLVGPQLLARSERAMKRLDPSRLSRISVLEGEASRIDFGLSAGQYADLARRTTRVHHLAVELSPSADAATAEQVNVGGARELIEFARCSERLRRIVFYSTAMVSGTRTGLVLEDELEAGQRFRCPAESTLARAERMLRQQAENVPCTVVRPTHIVGDSRTGEVDHLGGIYALIALLVSYPAELPVPLPSLGDSPLHLVPVDYVVDAAYELGQLDSALSRTFHLTDEQPPSAREAFELLAEQAGRRLPERFIPVEVARGLLKLPGVRRLTGNPRAVIDLVAHAVQYDTRNTRRALERSGLRCPAFADYSDKMVEQVRSRLRPPSE